MQPYSPAAGLAIHEAGHAVAVLALGHRVAFVSVRPADADGNRGVCEWQPVGGLSPLDEATIYLAGAAAEEAAVRGGAGNGWAADLATAASYGPAEQAANLAFLRRAWRRAKRIVAERLPAIGAVAEQLRRRGRLSGAQVVALARAAAQ